jgi:very-short-patch-repair endonuclease
MDVRRHSDGKDASPLIVALAERQYGVVARRQLQEHGMHRWTVDKALARRHLLPLHRGVFAVGHRVLTYRGRWMAAVLACGPEAVISHHAAAALHDLRPLPQGAIDVTAPTHRRHEGIRTHISRVARDERTEIDRIPVTSLERTLLDYAEQATPRQLQKALDEAERRTILDLRKLQRSVDRGVGRKGLKLLTAAIANLTDHPAWTQSPAEDLFLDLIRAADLPLPRANVLIHTHLVDFAWPDQKVIVEIDSFRFHSTREAFEDDRERDVDLQKLGWRVLRITDRRLHEDPAGVIRDVKEMLSE